MKYPKTGIVALVLITSLHINHASAVSERGKRALIGTALGIGLGAGIGGAIGGGEGAAIGAVAGGTVGATAGAAEGYDDGNDYVYHLQSKLDDLYRKRNHLENQLQRTDSDRRAERIQNELDDVNAEIADIKAELDGSGY